MAFQKPQESELQEPSLSPPFLKTFFFLSSGKWKNL